MNRKQILLAVLYCFLLIGSIAAQDLTKQTDSTDDVSTDILLTASESYKKPEYKEKEFVQVDATHFYQYTVFNRNGQVQIEILNERSKAFELCFKRPNPVVFIDAFQNYLVVMETSPLGAVLSYFVLTIVYDTDACKFYLDYFAVNPRVDSAFWHIPTDFRITRILEIDVNREWIAVANENKEQFDVFKINIAEKLNVLTESRWFYIKNCEKITGGNYRVLFDQTHNQFLVDTKNCLTPGMPAVYNKVSVSNLTCYPLYPCDSRVYNLVGYNFQYASQSENKKSMTTFLYRGYGDLPILGASYLKSKSPIRVFSDEYNFFIAITDCDVYLSNVYWNANNNTFSYFADTLSNVCVSSSQRAAIFKDWKDIEVIVFLDGKFYFISCNKFFVYGITPRYFTKIYEAECINNNNDKYSQLFIEINKYRALCK